MTALSERIVNDWKGRAHIARACVSVCDFLETTDPELVDELSFLDIQKIASDAASLTEEEVALIVQYLTGAGIGVLGIRCYFIDGEQEFLLPDEEYLDAVKSGLLAHPVTGEEVRDINRVLFPWFVPGRIFQRKRSI